MPALTLSQTGLGSLIRSLREERGLSAAVLSRQAGVSPQTIRNWEADKCSPRLPELQFVLSALGATASQERQAVELLQRPRAITHIRRRISSASVARAADVHVPVTLGDLLRAMRGRRGRTLEEVASKVGVVTRTLSRWERGESAPELHQLHSVCHALGASEEEIVMLTLGAAAVGVTRQTDSVTIEELRAQFESTQVHPTSPERVALMELTLIYLAIRLQPLAWQSAEARELLGHVYAMLTQRYYLELRHEKAKAFAERALELAEDIPMAAGYTIVALVRYTNVHKDPQENLKLLERWLPRVDDMATQAWMISRQADLLADMRLAAEADERSRESIALGRPTREEEEGRRTIRANLLFRLRQPDRAMEFLVPVTEGTQPDILLSWARVLVARKDYDGAQRMVDQALPWMDGFAGHWSHWMPYARRRLEETQRAIQRQRWA